MIIDVAQPHVHLGKGGGGGAVHHTAVVNDPISGPVVVEKVSRVGGIKGAGLGADSAQITLSDGPFGRRLYRVGPASYPFGLTGLDYYSYPNSLLTAPRLLRRKTVGAPNLSGLRPIGLSSGLKGGIIADPTTSQFSIGDAQVKTAVFGSRNLYRSGLSAIPYGLTGLDYYSYPNNLLLQRSIDGGFGLRQTKILTGGSAFTAGDSQVRGPVVVAQSPVASPLGQEQVTVVETDPLGGAQKVTTIQQAPQVIPQQVSVLDDGLAGLGEEFGQRKVTTTTITESADPVAAALGDRQITQTTVTKGGSGLSGLRGGQIILGAGPGFGGLRRVKTRPVVASQPAAVIVQENSGLAPAIGGFGQRQVTVTKTAPAPAPIVQAPVVAAAPRLVQTVQAPVAQVRVAQAPIISAPVAAPAPVQIVQAPVQRQFITRRPGEIFLSQVARPQIALARPAVAPVAPIFGGGNIQFTLGGNQIIGGPVAAPASRPVVVAQAPRQVVVSQAPAFAAPRPVVVAQAPRQVVVSQAPAFAAPRPVVVAQAPRQVVVSQAPAFAAPRQVVVAQRPQVVAQRPVVVEQRPQVISQVKGGVIGNNIFARRIPQMVYVDGGNRFLGIDIIGGYRVGDPRYGYAQLPYSGAGRFATLGSLSQTQIPIQSSIEAGPTLFAPAPAPVLASLTKAPVLSVSSPVAKTVARAASPLGLSPITKSAPSVVTQEEVVGPLGDRQVVTTVTKSEPAPVVVSGPSKIGGAGVSSPFGFAGIGKTSPAKTITQEEVVGPLGDRQVVTTVTESDSNRLVGSKIGGAVVSSPLGLTAVGQPSTKTITQEEVVSPLGDPQVVTTVTKTEPAGIVAGPSKIGGFATGGLAAIGRAPAKTITQEEVVGPLGDRQVVTTVTESDSNRLVGSKIGGAVVSSPLGLTAVGQPSTKTITQEEVVGPLGDPQVVTTVTKTEPASIVAGPSKIGGLATGGLAAIGQAPTKVITQEEVVGPAGDRQLLTTVTETDSNRLVGGKIGGPVVAGPLGLTAVGQTATKTITQEEVVGPLGDSQVVTTVTKTEQAPISPIVQQEEVLSPISGLRTTSQLSQEIAQDPIETVISQSKLASPLSQALVDPLGSGQTQVAIDSIGDPSTVTQVKETTFADPLTGAVNKVTEVSKTPVADSIVQQNIADTVVQESISPAFGGGLRFSPRLTFLSQHPYDVPDTGILRSILTRPVVQQQQELEQILVK
ncbi:hypothetical protein HNY73_003458 [Argiope bruennichi]|uniref:Uncharacterized protein n=1 Tax=Argiope bruennichi TaxID=94029 RepID=A0A8T0FN34_ARGBR|nr:hypothetical protein HNY73_003458 [Argiope bruennichi]